MKYSFERINIIMYENKIIIFISINVFIHYILIIKLSDDLSNTNYK